MTHWWAAPALLAAAAVCWLATSPLYTALRQRGWSWPLAGLTTLPLAIAALVAVDHLTPQWGALRKFCALFGCWVLLVCGEEIHEHRTGKPLLTLPPKDQHRPPS